MLDLWVIGFKVEIGAVDLSMTLHTSHRSGHESVSFFRPRYVLLAWPMARLTLHVGKLRSRVQRLEAAFFISHHMTLDATGVELLAPLFESLHGMRVAGLLPYLKLSRVARRALVDPYVRRFSSAKQIRGRRRGRG